MKKKPVVLNENYLARIPVPAPALGWSTDREGVVTLEVENTGWVNRLAQRLFGRPRISYVHLDATGSFVWPLLDGVRDVTALGELVKERFGQEAEPLYPRLAQFFRVLESYGFIQWKQ